jgi:phosphoserine phosphatase
VSLLYLARHGETDFNRAGRYQGQLESQLTELGSQQAESLAAALAPAQLEYVFSSPLQRCMQTAQRIAARHGLPVTPDARLLEIAHGTWEGRLRREIERDDAQRMHAWRTAPQTVTFAQGESLADVSARWNDFVGTLSTRGNALAVTHDVVMRLAILSAKNRPPADLWQPRVCNGGYAVFNVQDGAGARRLTLMAECESAHLGTLHVDPSSQAL